ncbi:hypothetical protein ACTXN9_08680 [Corynebacterium casei]|uniref:Uncharacterized protein n=1 Tax=Corynebacterium casei UCMA 3821 TaxID=1110505 RepID=G7HYC6_9CORY|nr:hypothetical protein [Corynebacterium casei]MDN5705503.1 hypothetical protein [Corynebacterium casei]MDN5728112.1 hypothetical protein [Corynebacterium casei]MDN5739711.1 hypothetical protein [Corynebacterium casei]MDN5798907.1 hypothetical protein [Corynebacterium casei]MDN5825590.1 hypothetical protein [Corynebacterium casei]
MVDYLANTAIASNSVELYQVCWRLSVLQADVAIGAPHGDNSEALD